MKNRFGRIEVVWVKIEQGFPIEPFAVGNLETEIGDIVVVETEAGEVLGTVVSKPISLDPDEIHVPVEEIPPVLRKATPQDIERSKKIKKLEREAFEFCKQRIEKRNLPMKLIKVKSALDKKRIVFYFTAEGRVDFRALVRDLARKYKTRIEMRQIGIRDEAKIIGGIGPCGRITCCSLFLNKFHSVSIKMAKEQYLMLNPSKISGLCGRLMCCLAFEYDVYKDLASDFPKVGEKIKTISGIEGEVISANIIDKKVIISLGESKGQLTVPLDEILTSKTGGNKK